MLLSINYKSKDKNIGQITLICPIFFYVYNVLLHLIMIEYHQTP